MKVLIFIGLFFIYNFYRLLQTSAFQKIKTVDCDSIIKNNFIRVESPITPCTGPFEEIVAKICSRYEFSWHCNEILKSKRVCIINSIVTYRTSTPTVSYIITVLPPNTRIFDVDINELSNDELYYFLQTSKGALQVKKYPLKEEQLADFGVYHPPLKKLDYFEKVVDCYEYKATSLKQLCNAF